MSEKETGFQENASRKEKRILSQRDFLQSAIWRKFQASLGKKTFLIARGDFQASIIEHELPFLGRYFYLPYGPILSFQEEENQRGWLDALALAEKRGVDWIRIEPEKEADLHRLENSQRKEKNSWRKTAKNTQPAEVLILNLEKDEDSLLQEMKAKTRYNLNLAKKKGVKIKEVVSGAKSFSAEKRKYLEEFLRLVQVTGKRSGIKTHPKEYYEKMFRQLPEENLSLFAAEFEGAVIAANLVVFFGDTAVYLHGGSDDQQRNVMAPFLLQWHQILRAKQAGCRRYDFGGVAIKTENEAWQGITRFKTGFCPQTESRVFPGTFDFILSKKKYLFYLWGQIIKNNLKGWR